MCSVVLINEKVMLLASAAPVVKVSLHNICQNSFCFVYVFKLFLSFSSYSMFPFHCLFPPAFFFFYCCPFGFYSPPSLLLLLSRFLHCHCWCLSSLRCCFVSSLAFHLFFSSLFFTVTFSHPFSPGHAHCG